MNLASRITRLALSLVATSAFCAGITRAQDEAPPPPPPPETHVFVQDTGPSVMIAQAGPDGPDAISFMAFEAGIPGKVVTGAPFSATISTEITHALADGNSIHRTVTGNIARDSQGRTRREMALPAMALLGPAAKPADNAIFINDPVAGKSYILRPDKKIAHEMPGGAHVRPNLRNQEGKGPLGGELGFGERFKNEETTTDLGTQTINGVPAQGTRITRTIPAGEIGNEKPIVMTTERWYSSNLQIYVLIKRSDPLIGDATIQYTNIQRQEPEASLFQVPADYTVKQGPPRGGIRVRTDGGQVPLPPNPPQD